MHSQRQVEDFLSIKRSIWLCSLDNFHSINSHDSRKMLPFSFQTGTRVIISTKLCHAKPVMLPSPFCKGFFNFNRPLVWVEWCNSQFTVMAAGWGGNSFLEKFMVVESKAVWVQWGMGVVTAPLHVKVRYELTSHVAVALLIFPSPKTRNSLVQLSAACMRFEGENFVQHLCRIKKLLIWRQMKLTHILNEQRWCADVGKCLQL